MQTGAVVTVRAIVFNATFNNISVILWQPDLLVEETRVPGENYRPYCKSPQTLSHKVVCVYTISFLQVPVFLAADGL
jgi:hypothetical protein